VPLFWIVHIVNGKPVTFIQEATGMEIARRDDEVRRHASFKELKP
jgi:hypothetical protein